MYLSVDGDWSVVGGVHAEDGGLWGVDDGGAVEGPKHAPIADGERPPIHVLYCQSTVTSLWNSGASYIIHMSLPWG